MRTRFTEALNLSHAVAVAPMARVTGGRLAAAVSRAGGLGLIGGGYGDADWVAREWDEAEGAEVGIGFITWSAGPEVVEAALARRPKALMLSFGDPGPHARAAQAAGVPVICQCQTLDHVREALDAGAAAVVAQGTEAGGHGASRGTMTLVAEVADLLAVRAPDCLLLAAGGIADGRGLAAALCLGADGAVVGTRFWAAQEALVPAGLQKAALAAGGDGTLRTRVADAARGLDWPAPFDLRGLGNAFTARWHADPDALRRDEAARTAWTAAQAAGDPDEGLAIVGEAVGLIHDIAPAATILHRMCAEAEAILDARATQKGSPCSARS